MTTQSLKERREEREREARELRARIQGIREGNIAKNISAVPQQVVQQSTTPFIPQERQAQVRADLTAQRSLNTPVGQFDVGAQSAAPENRNKPEFGSFLGSGMLENAAGIALPVLEQVQKGLETFGGVATAVTDQLTPGQLFASQNDGRGFLEILKETQAESGRGGSLFDVAGQAQNLAEAFRSTDMPATQVSLPGQGIPLPGGRKIDDIDVGVKGAIELLPEIVLGVVTGGGSAAGSLSKRTGVSILNALGADIAKGAVKVASKSGRKTLKAVSSVPAVVGRVPPTPTVASISARISQVKSPQTIAAINRLPNRFKGAATGFMSALSPARVADTTRAAIKAKLMNPMALDQIAKQNELFLADYVKRLSFAGQKVPTEVTEFNGYVEGVPFSTLTTVEKVDGAPDKVISGLIGNTGIPAIDRGSGTVTTSFRNAPRIREEDVFTELDTKPWSAQRGELDRLGIESAIEGNLTHAQQKQALLDSPNETETFYHVTTPEGAEEIGRTGQITSYDIQDGAHFRAYSDGMARSLGFGPGVSTSPDVPYGVKRAGGQANVPHVVIQFQLPKDKISELVPEGQFRNHSEFLYHPGGDTKVPLDIDISTLKVIGDSKSPGAVQAAITKKSVLLPYTEVFENFFVGSSTNAKRFLDKSGKPVSGDKMPKGGMTNPVWAEAVFRREIVAKEFGGANIGSWSIVVDKYVPDIRVKNKGEFDPIAANFATYVRHWQDSMESIELDWSRATGKEIKRTLVMDRVSSRFSPRNNNGDFLLEDADIANNSRRSGVNYSGKTPGATPKALKQRKLRNDEVRELVNEGQYSLSSPMVALKEHQLSMAKSAWDEQLKKHLKVLAKKKGSGVISISVKKSQAKRAISQILVNKGDVKPKTIASIKEQFPATAEALTKAMTHKKGTKIREKALKDIVNILESDTSELLDKTYIPTKAGAVTSRVSGAVGKKDRIISRQERMPAYTGLYFEDKGEVNRLVKQHYPNNSLADDNSLITATNNFSKILAETGDIIRLGKTGFDFGYYMIQGLPSLGFAAAKSVTPGIAVPASKNGGVSISHMQLGRKLVKNWVKSIPVAYEAFRSQDRMMISLAADFDVASEGIGFGLQIGRSSSDAFQALQGGTILRKTGALGEQADRLLTKAAAPFERAFIAPGDYIRIQMYKTMRPVAALKGEDGLRELASSLNNMTGAFSSSAAGINPTLQNVERGIIAFSARYTRSSLALLSDVFTGGIQGRTARESLAGMLGLGMATYITAVEAMKLAGSDQEIHLDPTQGDFMTFDIDGDRIGIGSFWTQFAKVTAKTAEVAWDEDAREAFLGDNALRDNPLIKWVRGRAAPTAGIGWDIAMGEDFLGRDIEGPLDWTKHATKSLVPIWFEAGVLSSPHRTGALGLAGELVGGRIRPLSSKERRRDLRNTIAQDLHGRDWTELNGLERKLISEGESDMSVSDEEELQKLDAEILAGNVERGDEDDLVIEKYHKRHTDIEDEWNENIAEGVELLTSNPEIMDLEKFRQIYLSSSNAIRRSKLEELNDADGEFAVAIEHFEKNADRFGEDNPEDIAYNQYVTDILATDDFDIPGGFDYDARDEAVKGFQNKWGDEVFAYVQERFRVGRNIPLLVSEFWQGRKRFEYYWQDVDEAVMATMPNALALEPAYKEWTRASENRRLELEETVPMLKAMIQKVSRVKRSMREQDGILDAWLFRWGFTQSLVSPDNQFSPDGVDDARDFWRNPKPMALETFGIQNGIAL